MLLVRDLLDKQLLDRTGEQIGKVDSIVLEWSGRRLRVDHIESSGVVLARRIHPRLAGIAVAIRKWWGKGEPISLRISWNHIRKIDVTVEVDRDIEQSPGWAWEQWLQSHIVEHIPGSGK